MITPRIRRFALALAALSLATAALAQSSNQPAVLGGNGRYVFGQINEYNADQYLLDTHTGRLWRLVDTAGGTGSVLEPVPYALPEGRSQLTPPEAGAHRSSSEAASAVPEEEQ